MTNELLVHAHCANCTHVLGKFHLADDGAISNRDIRQQPTPPRMERDEEFSHPRWTARCKCGTNTIVREDKLRYLLQAVTAAGLTRMPFRAPRG